MGKRRFLNPDSFKNVLKTAFSDFNPLSLQISLFAKVGKLGAGENRSIYQKTSYFIGPGSKNEA
jgi:hypothetical protein